MESDSPAQSVRAIIDRALAGVWAASAVDAATLEQNIDAANHRKIQEPIVRAFDEFFAVLNASYVENCRRLNRLAPINHLPDDVLTAIFAQGTLADHLVVSWVCSRWRSVAVHDARLWTELSLSPKQSMGLLEHLLSLSRSMPISLRLPASNPHIISALPGIVARDIDRMEELVVHGRDDAMSTMIHVFFPAAPRLRILRLEGVLDHCRLLLSLQPRAAFPALREIHLVRTSIAPETWASFPELVDVTWAPFPTGSLVDDIYNVLTSCPKVKRLRIYGLNTAHMITETPETTKAQMQVALRNVRVISLMGGDEEPIAVDLMPYLRFARHVVVYCSEALSEYGEAVLDQIEGPAEALYMRDSTRASTGEVIDDVLDGVLRDVCLDSAGPSPSRRELLRVKVAHLLLRPLRTATLRSLSLPVGCWTAQRGGGTNIFLALETLVLLGVPLVRPTSSRKMPACPSLRKLTLEMVSGERAANTTLDTLVSKLIGICAWPIQRIVVVNGKFAPNQLAKRAHDVQVVSLMPEDERGPFSEDEVLQDRLPEDWQ
ncbi:hypothetical protein EXIGLDRAFT_832270 [Exidia glandulosa HHB12029]|uniref:F-box domain-containing protein n=1 Tax=Exidia glandulosa HHB12029 TaxID=1314781 RepID=A0A165LUJ8_EXIGL|nr:hypothetical protein EXIGLDRAFT_832270 [Exidia glandulosa HHB12029]